MKDSKESNNNNFLNSHGYFKSTIAAMSQKSIFPYKSIMGFDNLELKQLLDREE